MNIFYLDQNLKKCAEYHCDKHVVKMILETAQLLSSACHFYKEPQGYKPTHQNHPCAVWTRSSQENFLWLAELGHYLNDEYVYRYKSIYGHRSFYDVIETLTIPKDMPSLGWTEPPKCMPDEFKVESVIQSYRNYYKGSKSKIATYKNRPIPEFMLC